jgi:colanic acid/amylovoran biosynthesis glycosyltransferase
MKADQTMPCESAPHSGAPLRIAYVLQAFPRNSETFILREMYWIRQHDVELYIFPLLPTRTKPVDKDATELLAHIRYTSVLSWKVVKAQVYFLWNSPRRYLRALAKAVWQTHREPKMLLVTLALFPKCVYFARQMKVLGIDHVHAHYLWHTAIAAGIASDLLGKTFTVHIHAFDLFESNQHDSRLRMRNASKIITVSKYNAAYIDKLLPGADPEVVYCGVDTDRFLPKERAKRSRPITILSVGRLIEKKGHEYLIDACALLAGRGLSFQCYIVGAGPLRKSLQGRIARCKLQDKVLLLGALGQERVLELNQHSDIFALACTVSKNGDRDGLPVAMIEAMSCGVPVVATPVTGVPELVDDGNNGLLTNERDAAGLAGALQKLITDGSLRRQMGQKARLTIIEKFRIQDNTAKLAAIFRELIRHAQSVGAQP